MEQNPDPYPQRPAAVRVIGCLAYPVGAAIVAALAFMIMRLV